ncbi:MAG TPA: hypothetical protein VLT86_20680 [Vicinamibacterales bacterium]|nr:hypothetical protein [Vicinamibacterales bacterium]
MKRAARVLTVLCAGASSVGLAQQTTFRSSSDAVFVDVSVWSERRAVIGLTRTDFALTDSGVAQSIDDVVVASEPVDLELVVDTGSELRSLAPAIDRDVSSVRSLLSAGDRSAIVTFDSQVRAGFAMGDPAARGETGTVLFDAISAALMQREEPGRRRMIVVVTAGLDTHSLLAAGTRRQIVQRSEPPVFLIAAGRRPTSIAFGQIGSGSVQSASFVADHTAPLHELATATGGRLFDLQEGDSFLNPLREALAEFRTRYVLQYRPSGVAATGWHDLGVKLTRAGSYDVRARRGYWRD